MRRLFLLSRCAVLAGTIGILCAPACRASHEDITSVAAAAAMGEAWTAVAGGIDALDFNPAGIGPMATPEFRAGYLRAFQVPAGPADLNQTSAALGVPLDFLDLRGAMGFSWANTSRQTLALDHMAGVTYATRGWREFDTGILDAGVTLKGLSRSGRATAGSVAKAGVDVGALFRMGSDRAAGLSILNVNGPRTDIGGVPDRAPVMVRAGYSEVYRGFTMAVDVVKREPSLGFRSGQSLGAGMQYWWHTARGGSWAGRTGLNLSDRSKFLGIGTGWRVLGGEADYALLAPLSSGKRWSHIVSLTFRFGSWNPEQEYEKLLDTELRYRQDLTRSLDAAGARQTKLAREIQQLREEIVALQSELVARTQSETVAREKLRAFEERQRRAQKALEDIQKEKRRLDQRSKESLYREDWAKYLKLKSEGASDLVLLERVQQILREYKDAGVDLSDANQELMRLLRNRPSP